MARITVSQAMASRCVSSNRGLNRRSESNTETQRANSMPDTRPFSERISRGPCEVWRINPSCCPSSISMASAGISSRDSRQATWTSRTPERRAAVRATSAVTRKSSISPPR